MFNSFVYSLFVHFWLLYSFIILNSIIIIKHIHINVSTALLITKRYWFSMPLQEIQTRQMLVVQILSFEIQTKLEFYHCRQKIIKFTALQIHIFKLIDSIIIIYCWINFKNSHFSLFLYLQKKFEWKSWMQSRRTKKKEINNSSRFNV